MPGFEFQTISLINLMYNLYNILSRRVFFYLIKKCIDCSHIKLKILNNIIWFNKSLTIISIPRTIRAISSIARTIVYVFFGYLFIFLAEASQLQLIMRIITRERQQLFRFTQIWRIYLDCRYACVARATLDFGSDGSGSDR